MNKIETINQLFDLVNNVKHLYLFCQDHLPNGIFLPLGIRSTFHKKNRKKKKGNKKRRHKNGERNLE